jgi:ribosomal protein L40E
MPRESPSAVYYIDVIVAIFLLIVGILTVIVGADYLGQRELQTYATPGYLIIVLGLAGIIYGVKRMIDDFAKGLKAPTASPYKMQALLSCPQCGAPISPSARFCQMCGAKRSLG